MITEGQTVLIPGVQRKVGTAFQVRQGNVLDALGTKAKDWRVCDFSIYKDAICWALPDGYEHVDTIYSTVDNFDLDGWTACQICGHPIKNEYYIRCDRKRYVMRVGSECFESYVYALTPEERTKWTLAKRAHVNPSEVARVLKTMSDKGWSIDKALIAVRAWKRAEKAFDKRYPMPDAELNRRHNEVKAVYWDMRKDRDDSYQRVQAWKYWMFNRVTDYATPGVSLLKARLEARNQEIKIKVEAALKRRGL